jgi:hypothetical protein
LNDAEKALGTVKLESYVDARQSSRWSAQTSKQFGELEDWEKVALNNATQFLDRSAAWA